MFLLQITIISAVSLTVLSCASESDLSKGSQGDVAIKINVQVPSQKNVSTRATTLSSYESTVSNLTILIFNSSNQLIGYGYSASPTSTGTNTYQMTVNTREATGCMVYAVANAGASAFASVNTLDEFKQQSVTLSAASDLGTQSSVVMQGVSATSQDITSSTQTLSTTIPLYRLCTKMNFNIIPSSDIKITGYQLHEVPASSYIADRSAETTPLYNPLGSYKDFDAVTESSPTNGSEVTDTYYIYENLAGTVAASNTAKARNSTNAPKTASYLDVYATGTNWKSTYRIYLGGTGTTDYTNYNIPRNYNYTYTINITGSGIYDVRVTCYPELINSSTGGTWSSNGSATAVTSSATATPGMYYFNDGTWGTLADRASATVYPIGVVYSGTTSANDKARGWTHGYALALTNAPTNATTKTCIWGPEVEENGKTFTDSYGTYTYSYYSGEYYADFTAKRDGYCETQTIKNNYTLSSSYYPAFYYAINYGTSVESGTTSYAAPSGSSGWFLPSIGQWNDIYANLGGITSTPTTSAQGYCYWYNSSLSGTSTYSYKCANNINAYLTAISTYCSNKGYSYGTPDSFSNNGMSYIGSDGKAYTYGSEAYWSSSEYNSTNAGYANFDSSGKLYLDTYYNRKDGLYFRVRCSVAF